MILFLFPIIAYGQGYQSFDSELNQIKERTKWMLGPFRIYPAIRFRNVGYDSNVYFQREDNNPISDFTATISAQINVYLQFE